MAEVTALKHMELTPQQLSLLKCLETKYNATKDTLEPVFKADLVQVGKECYKNNNTTSKM